MVGARLRTLKQYGDKVLVAPDPARPSQPQGTNQAMQGRGRRCVGARAPLCVGAVRVHLVCACVRLSRSVFPDAHTMYEVSCVRQCAFFLLTCVCVRFFLTLLDTMDDSAR